MIELMEPRQRKIIIDDIIAKIRVIQVIPAFWTAEISHYKVPFELCTLGITTSEFHQQREYVNPAVTIAQRFTDLDSAAYPIFQDDERFDGFSAIYKGSSNGLDEVAMEGIKFSPDHVGSVSHSELHLRPTKRVVLTQQDRERFDVLLMYAWSQLDQSASRTH